MSLELQEESLIQGTEAWKARRRTKVTGTDAGIILGVSPYCTPFKLWQRKLGIAADEPQNDFMKRGLTLEPVARERYEKENNILMGPKVCFKEHWLMASLDGINCAGDIILEIKTGKGAFNGLMDGKIPPHYYAQMQHNLYVSGANVCHYYVYEHGEGHLIEVLKNDDFISEMLVKEAEFFRCLVEQDPPAISDKDFVEIDDKEALKAGERFKEAKQKMSEAEKDLKEAKCNLLGYTDDGNCICGDVRITYVKGRKTTDWDSIRAKFSISDEDILSFTKFGTPYPIFNISK